MAKRSIQVLLIVSSALLLAGCGGEQRGGPREQTFPLTGIVHVDGRPVEGLQVICMPMGTQKVPTTIAGYTDKAGSFSVSTYEAGDGLPAGDYKLLFKWGAWNMSGQYGGPDRLINRYDTPERSPLTITVTDSGPNDTGIVLLTTQE